jgi:hypothetical protein
VTPEEAVLDRLLAVSGVIALVSTRIYQLKLPQHPAFPAIRVQLVDEPENYHLRGNDALTFARVQVDCFDRATSGGDPYLGAVTVAAAVNDALTVEGWGVGSPPRNASGVFRILRRAMFESEELQIVRVWQDYRVISAQT